MRNEQLENAQLSSRILGLRLREGLDDETIATRTRSDVPTVRKVLRQFAVVAGGLADADKTFKEYEADLLDASRRQILKHATKRRKLERASLHNLAFAHEKFLTGARLLRGETTQNVGLKAALVIEAHGAEPEPIVEVVAEKSEEPKPTIKQLTTKQAKWIKKVLPKQTPKTMPAPES